MTSRRGCRSGSVISGPPTCPQDDHRPPLDRRQLGPLSPSSWHADRDLNALQSNSSGSREDRWGDDSILPLQISLVGSSARAYAFAYIGVVAYWSDEEKCWCKDVVRPPLHVSVCC